MNMLQSAEEGGRSLVQRRTRAGLTRAAEEASISVFLSNLRCLLLTPPHRNTTVLAIDPGFAHGCKVAVLSHTGALLDTAVLRPNFRSPESSHHSSPAGRKLTELCRSHGVSTVAIGNGTACRETEALVAELIREGKFSGDKISYAIVSEQVSTVGS